MKIVFVGAGRLATQLARALHAKGHDITAVYSRTMESASELAQAVGGMATDRVEELPSDADAYIIAVKDSALPSLIPVLAHGREQRFFFHTAGSVPLTVFGRLAHGGVIYPMQTFSKGREVDFTRIPVFIEGSDADALQLARTIATSVSGNVTELDSERRRYLHLAAVFACNFANHCYTLAADIVEQQGLPFETMLPLIEETARKVQTMHPRQAQTGPAVRYDENVIEAQRALLADTPLKQDIYSLMSMSIHEFRSSGVTGVQE